MKREKKWYQKISNWLLLLACVVLIPIICINVYIMIQAKTNQDVVPSVLGYKPFMVLSGSMESKIYRGDLIITKIVDPEDLEVKDIIAFRDAQGTVTTHRIIDIVEKEGEHYFVTKGDNNDSQDQNLVEYKDVEGIYITRIPGIGSIMDKLSEPTTIVIIVLVITIIFGGTFAMNTRKERLIEQQEFLEYKRMKEEELKKASEEEVKEESKKKTSTKKKNTPKK